MCLLVYEQMVFWTGTEVLLKTAPVDPWDVFRGNYVTLRYEISELTSIPGNLSKDFIYKSGTPVYILLQKNVDGFYSSVTKTVVKPTSSDIFIKGIVTYDSNIEFGIESYFVEEGKGKDIEKLRGKDLMAGVVIDKEGRAVIKNLEVGGVPL